MSAKILPFVQKTSSAPDHDIPGEFTPIVDMFLYKYGAVNGKSLPNNEIVKYLVEQVREAIGVLTQERDALRCLTPRDACLYFSSIKVFHKSATDQEVIAHWTPKISFKKIGSKNFRLTVSSNFLTFS